MKNKLLLKPQVLLGYSGECSSSSCEAGQAREYMKNMLKAKDIEKPEIISATRLKELSRLLEKHESSAVERL